MGVVSICYRIICLLWVSKTRKKLTQNTVNLIDADGTELAGWIDSNSFKYFPVVRIEKQIQLFVFWEKVWLDDFVSRLIDL